MKQMSMGELHEERRRAEAWIESDENDGRLSVGSSAHLDMMGDRIEAINKELERRRRKGLEDGELERDPDMPPHLKTYRVGVDKAVIGGDRSGMMVRSRIDDMAREYHKRTEAFDRTVCTGRIVRGSIMPATAEERKLISRNAFVLREELSLRAKRLGFSERDLQVAIIAVGKGDRSMSEKVRAIQVATVGVMDPNSGLMNEVVIYLEDGGNMTGVDASYVEQEAGPIMSSVNNGELDLDESAPMVKPPSFEVKLRRLLNEHGMGTGSDTADFILSGFLIQVLDVYTRTLKARDSFNKPSLGLGRDACSNCGGTMVGDGHTMALHCENVESIEGREADAPPLYCDMQLDFNKSEADQSEAVDPKSVAAQVERLTHIEPVTVAGAEVLSRGQVESRVRRIIFEHGCEEADKYPAEWLSKAQGIMTAMDSLDRVELIMSLEEEFKIDIFDDEAGGIKTPYNVIGVVCAALRRKNVKR